MAQRIKENARTAQRSRSIKQRWRTRWRGQTRGRCSQCWRATFNVEYSPTPSRQGRARCWSRTQAVPGSTLKILSVRFSRTWARRAVEIIIVTDPTKTNFEPMPSSQSIKNRSQRSLLYQNSNLRSQSKRKHNQNKIETCKNVKTSGHGAIPRTLATDCQAITTWSRGINWIKDNAPSK